MPQSFGLVSAPAPPCMKRTAGRRSPFAAPGGAGSARRGASARPLVVELVDLVLDLGREADAVEAVAAQAPHGAAHLADLAHRGARVAVLDVDERLRLRALG